jgi:hypothetical protein
MKTKPINVPVGKGRWTINGLQLADSRGIPTLSRARTIQATLGTYAAARFLLARGWSVEAAAFMLAHRRAGA